MNGRINIMGRRIEATAVINNVVTDAGGGTGNLALSPNIRFGLVEVKAGFTARNVMSGAAQVAAAATFLKASGLPGVAILPVDKASFGKLNASERAKIFNMVNKAGGYIQLYDELAAQAAKRARDAIKRVGIR